MTPCCQPPNLILSRCQFDNPPFGPTKLHLVLQPSWQAVPNHRSSVMSLLLFLRMDRNELTAPPRRSDIPLRAHNPVRCSATSSHCSQCCVPSSSHIKFQPIVVSSTENMSETAIAVKPFLKSSPVCPNIARAWYSAVQSSPPPSSMCKFGTSLNVSTVASTRP